jgi:3-oxoacyl-[acyl-carrier protein] reductase
MAGMGYHVFINYRSSHADAAALVSAIQEAGGSAATLCANVADKEAVQAMFEEVSARCRKLDVLVHSPALPLVPEKVLELDWSRDVEPQMAVNAAGFLNVIQGANRLLVADSRVIVLLTDGLFHTPPVQMGAYLAAKGALWGLVRAVAKELRSRGVRVNTVSPSMVDTELLGNYHQRAREIFAQDHPLGRLATADEVAAVITAIATEAGSYLHGTNIIVNGGGEL